MREARVRSAVRTGAGRGAGYRPDIEGLRGIAVLIVVAFHCRVPGLAGGFVGVDVFFALSGYLITGLLVAEVRKTSRLNLAAFYARRARRLLPAAALTLVVTLLIGALVLAPQELAFAGRAARATALYLSNMFFAVNAADYFAPNVETNPMLHTWSLAVEEQFYLFWPLLIVLGLQFWRSTRALAMLLSGLTLVSLAACLWLTANAGTFAFYGLPARAWEFGLGGLAVLLPRRALRIPAAGWLVIGWLGVLVILVSGSLISPGPGFPGWVALMPVLGTVVALIAGFELPVRGVGVLLGSGPLQFVGTLSYSWYLWHWPVLVLSAALFPNIAMGGRIVAAALSLAAAAITHSLVENPIRFHPYLLNRAGLSLCLAAGVTVCSSGAALLAMRWADRLAHAPAMKNISAAVDDIADMPREDCVTLGDSPEVKPCVFGNPSAAVNWVLFGDSHAIQWFNPLRRMAGAHGWRLTTFVKSGCPGVDVSPPGTSPRFQASCAAWRAEAIRRILTLRPAMVIVGSATLCPGRNHGLGNAFAVSLDEWRKGTRRTLSYLAAGQLRVVALRDTPLPPFDVPTCLARSARHSWYPGGSCAVDRSMALDTEAFEAEKAAARGLPGVHLLDMTDVLCSGELCPVQQNGAIVYRDNNHLTGSFAASLTAILQARLLPILNAPR